MFRTKTLQYQQERIRLRRIKERITMMGTAMVDMINMDTTMMIMIVIMKTMTTDMVREDITMATRRTNIVNVLVMNNMADIRTVMATEGKVMRVIMDMGVMETIMDTDTITKEITMTITVMITMVTITMEITMSPTRKT